MNISEIKISIIVPIYPPHFNKITGLITNFNRQTVLPNEVIICASECNDETGRKLIRNLQTKYDLIVDNTLLKNNQAENRNRGIKKARYKYVMNVDADDFIHYRKIELMKKIITERPKVNLICHNYFIRKPPTDQFLNYPLDFDNIKLYDNSEKYAKESRQINHTNLCIEGLPVVHGHVLFNKNLNVFYNEGKSGYRCSGEDGQFCRDILFNYGNIIYINEKLMIYI